MIETIWNLHNLVIYWLKKPGTWWAKYFSSVMSSAYFCWRNSKSIVCVQFFSSIWSTWHLRNIFSISNDVRDTAKTIGVSVATSLKKYSPWGIIGSSNQKTTTKYQQTMKNNKQTTKTNNQKSLPLVIAPKQEKNNQQPTTKPSSFFLVSKNQSAPGNSSTPRSWFPRLPRCHFEVLRRHSRCLAVKKPTVKPPRFPPGWRCMLFFGAKMFNSWLKKPVWWLDGFKGFKGFGLCINYI